MIRDIVTIDGADLGVLQTEAPRAGNLLAVQLGDLEYAPDLGVDKKYFLESEFRIQNESFKAYLVQRLLEQHVNVIDVVDTIETVFHNYGFNIGTSVTTGGFVA